MAEDAGPVVGPAGEDAGPRRRTDGTAGVEPLEPEPRRGHRIELGRLQPGMPPIAGLPPPHVVGHDEDDVRASGGGGVGRRSGDLLRLGGGVSVEECEGGEEEGG
jgi:hypothetical protein